MDRSLQVEAVVDAPPAAVFELITDIGRLPEWNAEISEVVEQPPVLEPGAQWVVEIRALKSRWKSRSTAREVDPAGGRFSYRSQSDDGNPSFADWEWELTPEGTGTRVRVAVSMNPRTFLRQTLAIRIRPPGLEKAMRRSLAALQPTIEAGRPGPAAG